MILNWYRMTDIWMHTCTYDVVTASTDCWLHTQAWHWLMCSLTQYKPHWTTHLHSHCAMYCAPLTTVKMTKTPLHSRWWAIVVHTFGYTSSYTPPQTNYTAQKTYSILKYNSHFNLFLGHTDWPVATDTMEHIQLLAAHFLHALTVEAHLSINEQ